MALENVDCQMRKYDMKCGFTELLSTLVKFLPFLFEQCAKAGSTKDASCIANLFISAPCFGSLLQWADSTFHPLQELQNKQPASPKHGTQINSATCGAELGLKMCVSKFYGDFWLCGGISMPDVSGPQQLRNAICSLTQCIFSWDSLERGLWF